MGTLLKAVSLIPQWLHISAVPLPLPFQQYSEYLQSYLAAEYSVPEWNEVLTAEAEDLHHSDKSLAPSIAEASLNSAGIDW